MTFTEAAVEVLRLVGKPLHYKKITEIAIERNLLSHVGKTPETTMSSRLATMVRKDRGEAPIIKVKPGVFGLREFSAEVLETARHESGHDYEIQEKAKEADASPEDATETTDSEPPRPKRAVPGADMFPEEDDDDEPILAALDSDSDDDEKKGRKRRRRKKRGEENKEKDREKDSKRGRSRRDKDRDRDRDRGERGGRRGKKKKLEGDWERTPESGDSGGLELADAVAAALSGGRRKPKRLVAVAETLVQKGRLAGDPKALVPTLAANVRGDEARRRAQNLPPRFRWDGEWLSLAEWALPVEAVRAETDALKAAQRQRELVRRVFIRTLSRLPATGLLELLATWLNAEGVVGLRGVRPPQARPNEYHLAGTLKRGPESIPLAIHVVRDASLTREKVVEIRGAMHHYGDAKIAWLISLGSVLRGAEEEVSASAATPVALFGGNRLAESMEAAGVGIKSASAPIVYLDLDLLDELHGPGRSTPIEGDESDEDDDEEDGKKRRRRRRRGRRRDKDKDAEASDGDADADADADADGDAASDADADADADAASDADADAVSDADADSDTDADADSDADTDADADTDTDTDTDADADTDTDTDADADALDRDTDESEVRREEE